MSKYCFSYITSHKQNVREVGIHYFQIIFHSIWIL